MKLSIAQTLVCAPSERIADVCSGIVGEKLLTMCWFGSVYSGIALRSPPPSGCSIGVDGAGTNGGSSMRAGSSRPALTIRSLCELLHNA